MQATITHGTLGDNVIGKMLNLAHRPLEHADFKTVLGIEMHMHAGNGQVMVVMERAGQSAA